MSFANRHLFFQNKTRAICASIAAFGVFAFVVSGSALADDSAPQNPAPLTTKSGTESVNAPSQKAAAKPSPTASGSDALTNLPMPIGRDFEGINLPWYDASGHLQMNFHVVKARRVDKDNLALQQLYVNTYSEDGSPDATITIKSAMLNLVTKILTSKEPVTVERADFKIVGAQMEFNTATHEGKFIGKVKMWIYNNQSTETSKNPKGGA